MALLLRLLCIGAFLCSLAFSIDQTINIDTPEEETIILGETADTPPISKKQVDDLSLEVIDYALQHLDKKHSKKTKPSARVQKPLQTDNIPKSEPAVAEKLTATQKEETPAPVAEVAENETQEVVIEVEEVQSTPEQTNSGEADNITLTDTQTPVEDTPATIQEETTVTEVTAENPTDTDISNTEGFQPSEPLTGFNENEQAVSEAPPQEEVIQTEAVPEETITQDSAAESEFESLDALVADETAEGENSFLDSLAGAETGDAGIAGWGMSEETIVEEEGKEGPEYNNLLVVDLLGEVMLERNRSPAKLLKGAYVTTGDTLTTSRDSGIVLKYLDSLIILGSQSKVYVTDIFPNEERNTVILKTKKANLKITNKTEENRITLWTEEASLQIIQAELAAKISPYYEVYYGLEGTAPIMYHGLEETLLTNMEFTIGYADMDPTKDDVIGLPIYKARVQEENLPTLTLSGEFNFQEFNATRIASANEQVHEVLTKHEGEEPPEILKVSIDPIKDKKDKINKINYEANRLMENEEYKSSRNLLAFYKKQKLYNKESLFLLGKSAAKSQKLQLAEENYEELLAQEESAHRVRLELAAVQFQQNKLEAAKQNLEIVKASRPPKKVGENIELFLGRIEKETPKEFSYTASIGYLYDDNVNAGPNEDTILIYNLPFSLSDDAREREDKAFLLKLGLTHNIYSGAYFDWASTLNFSITDYQRINAYDTQSVSMSTGPVFETEDTKYSIPMIFSRVAIGLDYDYYYFAYGVAPQAVYSLSDRSRIKTIFTWHSNDYNDDIGGDWDSVSTSAGISFQYLLTQSSFLEPSFRYGAENAKSDTNTYDYYLTGLTYYSSLYKNLSLYLNPTVSAEYYQQQVSAFNNQKRKDYVKSMTTSLSYYYDTWKLNTTFVHAYTDNSSNIELYDYGRHQLFLFFSGNF